MGYWCVFLLCGVGVNSDLHNPMEVHPPMVPSQVPITQEQTSNLVPSGQEYMINGRIVEQLAPSNGLASTLAGPKPSPLQQQQQQQQHQQSSAMQTEAANYARPETPGAPGNVSHASTPYASPAPTPVHMSVEPVAPPQDPAHNASLDLSRNHGQRSPIINGGSPRVTPRHTPVHSPTPGSFHPTNPPLANFPDQYRLQLIPETQFKQEIMNTWRHSRFLCQCQK